MFARLLTSGLLFRCYSNLRKIVIGSVPNAALFEQILKNILCIHNSEKTCADSNEAVFNLSNENVMRMHEEDFCASQGRGNFFPSIPLLRYAVCLTQMVCWLMSFLSESDSTDFKWHPLVNQNLYFVRLASLCPIG